MDGFRTQSFSDTTKSSLIMNQSRILSSTVIANSSSSSTLHVNPNRNSQNPTHPVSHATKFHPSLHPPANSASLTGYSGSSSRFPVPVTSSTSSSCHSFPSSSSKEERNSSSISSSSASDSDYDSAPLTANVTLPRRCAEMAAQRYGETDVAMGNDETMTTRKEDANRMKIRRERNKQAAARCRQRRVDLTNLLTAETETLDMVRADLEREVENLMRQKNQLEFIIQAHQTQCRMHVTPPHSAPAGSIPQFVKLESSDTSSFLRPPFNASSQLASGSINSTHVGQRPHCQQLQHAVNPIFNSSTPAVKGYDNQMTSMTSANYNMSSTTSLSQASSSNTMSSMTRATVTMTLPVTSVDADQLMSPATLDAFGSFDFCALLDEQVGSTPVTDAPSSSSTSVVHNRGDEILPITLLNL